MQFRTAGSLALVASLALSSFASAAVLFSDDFEGVGYTNGQTVNSTTPDVGQPWNPIAGSGSSTIRDGTDVGFVAPAGSGGTFYASLGDRIAIMQDAAGITATTSVKVYTEFDFYVNSAADYGLELITWSPSARGIDALIKSNGTLSYYTNLSNTFNPVANFSFTTNSWQHGSLVIDYATGAASLTVGSSTGNFTVADPGSISLKEFYFNANALQNNVYVDNIVVSTTPVPEPASLSLIGLGALGLLSRRRKA
ncbi:MAG: PEP-CTERM sorting domain-containing protein [Phycisphaerales bacterium]|jgi:hypothetical protein|nr:PEP-CTERM sorting domain-containing protein [Phycisphaerales bacterium]